jgi:diguanylate cyclase (GGDEF) domain
VVLSVSIATIIIGLFAADDFPILFVIKMSVLMPLIIAPVLSWYLIGELIKIHRLEREMYVRASYDMLTGFLSRNAFFTNLKIIYDLAMRNKTTFSIASIDIDNFKAINDTYGHAGGDQLLTVFGLVLKNSIRVSDYIGRIGGDEFVLVLPSTSLDAAYQMLEKIRYAIMNTRITFQNQEIQFTISIGVSEIDTNQAIEFDELLIDSDHALYKAKNAGRNCTIKHLN